MDTAALILAAGASRRMGTNKLLLDLDGEPLVRRAARRAHEAGLSPLIVVLGHEARATRDALSGIPCLFAANPDPDGPTSDSLHAGIRSLPAGVEAAVVLLADMVEVTSEMLAALPAAAGPDTLVVASRYGAVTAPPALFRREIFPEVLAWNGEGCVRGMVRAHPEEAVLVDWPAEALTDLDTPEDLERWALTRLA